MPVGAEAVQTTIDPSSSATAKQSTSYGSKNGGDGLPGTLRLDSGAAASSFLSREDVKKQRELEEARKSGLIPAEKDEEGKDINPHIPQYIAKAPWYLSHGTAPSLKHQRFRAEHQEHNLNKWYKRGVLDQPPAVLQKFRKGACTNCGAMTHTAKGCTERPRLRGAKWSGTNIRPDEIIVVDSTELQLDFDGKRDPYGGYDPSTYDLVIHDFELADQERKRRKAVELQEKSSLAKRQQLNGEGRDEASDADGSDDSDSDKENPTDTNENDDDDDVKVKEFDQTNAPVGMKDDRARTTTMNLRIREDTAKYLFNLDVNSAFYDPKTRSMRENPLKHCKEAEQGIFRGDNAMRNTAETECVRKMEIFSWEAYKHNVNVHAQAQPTQLELMHKEFHRKQQRLVELKRQNLLEKYGGAEHLDTPQALLLSQSEVYQEFNPTDGSVKRLKNRVMAKSKYDDDALFGQHTAVWGSWYDREAGAWGYACCHQKIKSNPECTPDDTIVPYLAPPSCTSV